LGDRGSPWQQSALCLWASSRPFLIGIRTQYGCKKAAISGLTIVRVIASHQVRAKSA